MSTTPSASRKKTLPTPAAAPRTRKPRSGKSAPDLDAERSAMRTLELVFFVHLQMADIADQVLVGHGLGRPTTACCTSPGACLASPWAR